MLSDNIGSTANAYLGKLSKVEPLVTGFARTTPMNIVLILSNVRSRSVSESMVSEPRDGVARSVVPSSTVPSLLPKIVVKTVLRRDASSGVKDSRVCA